MKTNRFFSAFWSEIFSLWLWTGSHRYRLRGSYPNCPAQRLSVNRRGQLGGCSGWNEPLQPFGRFRTFLPLPERYLYRSIFSNKTQRKQTDSSLHSEVRSSLSGLKWLPRDSAKFVLKEGSKNSTDSLIALLSESGTFKEEYFLPSSFLYSGCSSKVKANILPEICIGPAASIILWRYWLTTVRPYGDLVVLSSTVKECCILGDQRPVTR